MKHYSQEAINALKELDSEEITQFTHFLTEAKALPKDAKMSDEESLKFVAKFGISQPTAKKIVRFIELAR